MSNELSVSAVLVEQEDGSYKANCPELNIQSQGDSADDALQNLKDAVLSHVREVGSANIQLNAVKCLKFKIPL